MGAQNSKGDYGKDFGQAFIQTEVKDVILGSFLDGIAHLNITQPLQGNTITLYLVGREYCHWTEQESYTVDEGGQSVTKTRTVVYKGKNKHCNIPYQIFTYPGGQFLPPGQYSIPFRIPIPSHLPGSVEFEWHEGKIYYNLVLKAGGGNKKQVVKTKRPLSLVSQQQGQSQSFLEKTVHMKTWCCISQGTANMKLYSKQNSFVPGGMAEMACELDNSKGSIDFENIKFFLKQKLTTSAQGVTRVNEIVMQQFNSNKVKKGAILNGNQSIFINIPITDKNHPNKLLSQTTNGSIVKVEYYLEAFGNLDGCICESCNSCCGTVPDIKIPISVFGMPPNYHYFQVDPNQCMQQIQGQWAPQVMPQAQFDMSYIQQYNFNPQIPNQNLQGMNNQMNQVQYYQQPQQNQSSILTENPNNLNQQFLGQQNQQYPMN